MKTFVALILSFALAFAVCFMLHKVGVLKFDGEKARSEFMKVKEKVLRKITAELGSLSAQKDPSTISANEEIRSDAFEHSYPELNPSTQPNIESDIYTKVLNFFTKKASTQREDIEEKFAEFLRNELNLEPKEIERQVRMSFWKNFITLQDQWTSAEIDQMQMAFDREKDLKIAAFKARGLNLMTADVEEAEARLLKNKQKLMVDTSKGES